MIELLRKLKSIENPSAVDEIKGNEKVLYDKRKNLIAIVSYPKTIQFDKVVQHNSNDWEYLDEEAIIEYLGKKGIVITNKDTKEQAPIEVEKLVTKTEVVIEEVEEQPAIEQTKPIEKKKGGRPSKK